MKYYTITVNGVAYSVTVEETAAGAAPVPAPAEPEPQQTVNPIFKLFGGGTNE